MNPLVKKIVAGLAIKELVDRVQEARRPQRSFASRHKGKALWAVLLGGAAYLFQSGKAQPLIQQAKSMAGLGDSSADESSSYSSPDRSAYVPTNSETSSESERPLEPSHS
jgi:hypothetical protein